MGKAAKKQGLRRSQEDRDRVRAERQLSGSIEEEIETKRASLRRKLSSGKILGSLGRVPDVNDATIKCACILLDYEFGHKNVGNNIIFLCTK